MNISIQESNELLLVGPSRFPITGQSYAFYAVVDAFPKASLIVNSFRSQDSIVKFFLRYLWALLKLLILPRCRLCYFTSSRTKAGFLFRDLPLILLCSLKGVRLVNHLHGADFSFFRKSSPFWLRALIDFAYRKVSNSIVLFEDMKQEYESYRHMTVHTVPNFFIRSFVESKDIQLKLYRNSSKRTLRLLFLSNLMREKGVVELCHAVQTCISEGFDVSLTIAGEKLQTLPDLDELIDSSIRIRYLGVVSGKEKEQLLLECDVVCLPSYYKTEAQPICLIEGMAFGNAIISTIHNYLPVMISPESGLTVPVKDEQSLTDAIKILCKDRIRMSEMQRYNSAYASVRYSLQEYISNLETIFSALLYDKSKM